MLPHDFIAMIAPSAQELQHDTKLYASVTIAQACWETGYGKSIPVDRDSHKVSYNLFGIKGEGPNGSVNAPTWEVENGETVNIIAQFRAYHNIYESLADHLSLLIHGTDDNPERYKPVLDAPTPEDACDELYKCGYATDPNYPNGLKELIAEYNLTQYDVKPIEAPVAKPYNVEEDYKDMKVADANLINDILGKMYVEEITSQEEKDKLHYLANEVRKASGQPQVEPVNP